MNAGAHGTGDVWVWTALDAETRLIASWEVGDRRAETAYSFISDLAGRLANRVSPAGSEGPISTGITGYQGPTR